MPTPRAVADRAKFYFQILSTPTADTPGTTLLLHFDNQRYLFGSMAEGTQRMCVQRGIGLKKVKNIFITGRSTWGDIGGLIGMILTMADQQSTSIINTESSEKPRLSIHGGPLLTHSVACGRRFVFRVGMPVSITEHDDVKEKPLEEPWWSDENIQVWAIPAHHSRLSIRDSEGDSGSMSSSSSDFSPRKRSHDEFMEKKPKMPMPSLDRDDQAIRRSVVTDMFDSGWRRDVLIETTWAEVEKPAAMWIRDPDTHALIPLNFTTKSSIPPDLKVLVRKPWPAALLGDLPAPPPNFPRPTMSYIVRGYPQRGVFDPKKAAELGVPKGPMFKQLVDGETLELSNGTLVKPEMVLGPTKPGRGIAIVDLPSRHYVEDLLSRPEWASQQIMTGIEAFCWILGDDVAEDPRLLAFMQSQGPDIKHIISSTSSCSDYLAMDSSAASAIRLSRISKDHFPVPVHDNRTVPQVPMIANIDASIRRLSKSGEALRAVSQPAERGLIVQVEPRFELQHDEVPPWLDAIRSIRDTPEAVAGLAKAAREDIAIAKSNDAHQSEKSGHAGPQHCDPEVITLGTGSSSPSKYRNVSATLLRIPGKGSYLFDCGENTIGQLARVFGPKELHKVLLDLKFIWISHLHADHHLGTLGVLAAFNRAIKTASAKQIQQRGHEDLFVVSEGNMIDFLNDYAPLSGRDQANVIKIVQNPQQGTSTLNGSKFTFGSQKGLHISELRTCYVRHCKSAQAVSVKFDNGFKFSYSGDCRPSSLFATIGQDSDVLVHEATFDDGMEGDAIAKRHSTTSEALAVASLMKAKNVVLTHFSQRYQKIPVMSNVKPPQYVKFEDETEATNAPVGTVDEIMDVEPGQTDNRPLTPRAENSFVERRNSQASVPHDMNVCVAFDYMRVRVSDIKYMHKLTPALTALFETSGLADADPDITEEDRFKIMNGRRAKKTDGQDLGNNGVRNRAQKSAADSEAKRKRREENEAHQVARRERQQKAKDEQAATRRSKTGLERGGEPKSELSQAPSADEPEGSEPLKAAG